MLRLCEWWGLYRRRLSNPSLALIGNGAVALSCSFTVFTFAGWPVLLVSGAFLLYFRKLFSLQEQDSIPSGKTCDLLGDWAARSIAGQEREGGEQSWRGSFGSCPSSRCEAQMHTALARCLAVGAALKLESMEQ